MKNVEDLATPDPYFAGNAGIVGSTLQNLHSDMAKFDLPDTVPEPVRRMHDSVRHAYIYSYFSYDLITLAAAQAFPCLELALKERLTALAIPFTNPTTGRPLMLSKLLASAKAHKLISTNIEYVVPMRNMFAHGSDAVLNVPLFLAALDLVTGLIRELHSPRAPKPRSQ